MRGRVRALACLGPTRDLQQLIDGLITLECLKLILGILRDLSSSAAKPEATVQTQKRCPVMKT